MGVRGGEGGGTMKEKHGGRNFKRAGAVEKAIISYKISNFRSFSIEE